MQTDCDVLIAGNGLAALTLALSLPESFRIVILCKNRLDDTASRHAQGGIAAAWSGEDDIEKHVADTLEAGADAVGFLRSAVEDGQSARCA